MYMHANSNCKENYKRICIWIVERNVLWLDTIRYMYIAYTESGIWAINNMYMNLLFFRYWLLSESE